jgi:hypothetical protein
MSKMLVIPHRFKKIGLHNLVVRRIFSDILLVFGLKKVEKHCPRATCTLVVLLVKRWTYICWTKKQMGCTCLTEWRSVKREISAHNYRKYATMNTYLQNQHIYTEQEGIPFRLSKWRSILQVTFNLPSKLAQTVTLLSCIGRSRFRIPSRAPIIMGVLFVIYLSLSTWTP